MRLSGAIIVAIFGFGSVGLVHAAPMLSFDESPRRMSRLNGKKARISAESAPPATRAARFQASLQAARGQSRERVSISPKGATAKLNRFASRRAGATLFSSPNSPAISARQLAADRR